MLELVRPFSQVDVFAPGPKSGNPVAVVHDADALSTEQMQAFANWTNLSETTFLLAPSRPEADYRLRIFTPMAELPFAGHPTLGSAHAWLAHGGQPRSAGMLVQECEAGLISVRRDGGTLAFSGPPLLRSGPLTAAEQDQVAQSLGITSRDMLRTNWIDNGPGWIGVHLDSAAAVLALKPDFLAMGDLAIGVIGAYGAGGPADYEVRAFAPGLNVPEDPVCGSVNASFAEWLTREGVASGSYTVQQGTALGRGGQVLMHRDADGTQWVGGECRTVIAGSVQFLVADQP